MRQLNRQMVAAASRPTRVIQFGEGNFLRAFVEPQLQRMDDAGLIDAGVAIVQPLPDGRVDALERQDRLYTVLAEGLRDGVPVREHRIVDVVTQTVDPYRAWDDFLALAENADARVIVSNTTEAGIALDPRDQAGATPPHGFPAKLAHLLARRFAAGLPGFVLLPCELVDDNGAQLKRCVLDCVRIFGLGGDLAGWIDSDNVFCSTLVDRIVSGYPGDRAESLWQEFGYRDELIVVAEPAMSWVIQGPASVLDVLPWRRAGLNVTLTDDLTPYRTRKVRLLNGPHTTMAQLGRLAGLDTVADVMGDPAFRRFVEAEMRDEIAPTVALPADDLASFSAEVLERFQNPWLRHRLDAIALNSVSKFGARLAPVILDGAAAGRPLPRRVVLGLAGLLAIYAGPPGAQGRGERDKVDPIDTPDVLNAVRDAAGSEFVPSVLEALWGQELCAVPGLVRQVGDDLAGLAERGVRAMVEELA